jgi:LysR family hydrogen peroxide-inducible transcriptional activator
MTFRATSLSTLAQMVAGGAGITLLPELAVPSETRRSAIRVRKLAEPTPARTIALVWRKSSPLADALRRLASTLREARSPRGRAKQARR